MAALTHPVVRKWLSFGSGAGIRIGEHDLEVTLATVRPGGARLMGRTVIERFRQRPAAEWGAEYARFLGSCGMGHVAALAVLPREEVIVRQVSLPGVSDKDAPAAVEFQLDGLHPYQDEEVSADWVRLGATPHFMVAIAERSTLNEYLALFSEAGVKLAGLTVSAGVYRSAVRILRTPPEVGFLAAPSLEGGRNGALELYGESPARALFSGVFDAPLEQAAPLAFAELRLVEEAAEAKDLIDLLAPIQGAPAEFDFARPSLSRVAPGYAAALAAACPHLGVPVNLLPMDLRVATSRARYIPTAALAVVLAALGVALLLQGRIEDRNYLEQVQAESGKLESRAQRVDSADREAQARLGQILLLDAFRRRSKEDLDALFEITNLIPASAYATGLVLGRDQVAVGGEGDQAEGLLKAFDNSPFFESSEFAMPLTRLGGGLEQFRIRTTRTRGARR